MKRDAKPALIARRTHRLETLLKVALSWLPRGWTAAMIATDFPAAGRPFRFSMISFVRSDKIALEFSSDHTVNRIPTATPEENCNA